MFTIQPESKKVNSFHCPTLKTAIGMRHCLIANLKINSVIFDESETIVSEQEQSRYISNLFLS